MSRNDLAAESLIHVHIYPNRIKLGLHAAEAIAAEIRKVLERQARVRMIFAAAPSQEETLTALRTERVEWQRIDAFHMDEYIDLAEDAPQRFGNWLKRHLFDHVPMGSVHLLDPGGDAEKAAAAYAALLNAEPIDIVCCGIGSNGHLAFNDPPADFEDPFTVKVVELDERCRQQQVDDECFSTIKEVPAKALTVTIPALMRAGALFCSVPGKLKHEAVKQTLFGERSPLCPASILREHPHCELYLDADSAGDIR